MTTATDTNTAPKRRTRREAKKTAAEIGAEIDAARAAENGEGTDTAADEAQRAQDIEERKAKEKEEKKAREAAAKALAKQKADDERAEHLQAVGDSIVAAASALNSTAEKTAQEMRDAWVALGSALQEGQEQFRAKPKPGSNAPGNISNTRYNAWIKSAGFEELLPNRNERSFAIRLAGYAEHPDFYALIPDTLGSAQTVCQWVRKMEVELFEYADNEGIGRPPEVNTDAVSGLLVQHLTEQAMAASSSDAASSWERLIAFVNHYPDAYELGVKYASYAPRQSTAFVDLTTEAAARRLASLALKRKDYETVLGMLSAAIAAMLEGDGNDDDDASVEEE